MAPKNKNKAEETTLAAENIAVEPVEEAVEEAVEAAPEVTAPVPTAAETAAQEFKALRELVAVTPPAPVAGEDPNYQIGINGRMWILPRGKTSKVPKYVAMAFDQAEAAKGAQAESQAKLLKKQSGGTVDLSKLTADQIEQLKVLLGL